MLSELRLVDRECCWAAWEAALWPVASELDMDWEWEAWSDAEDWPAPAAVHPLYWYA